MKDGKPGEQKDRRVEHIIPTSVVRAGRYEVIIEVSCNSMFGLGPYRYQTPDVSLADRGPACRPGSLDRHGASLIFPDEPDIRAGLCGHRSAQSRGSRSSNRLSGPH